MKRPLLLSTLLRMFNANIRFSTPARATESALKALAGTIFSRVRVCCAPQCRRAKLSSWQVLEAPNQSKNCCKSKVLHPANTMFWLYSQKCSDFAANIFAQLLCRVLSCVLLQNCDYSCRADPIMEFVFCSTVCTRKYSGLKTPLSHNTYNHVSMSWCTSRCKRC